MPTSKLSLYNGANAALGERKLTTLAENRPSRRRLDSWWDGGGPTLCLQAGFWNFAMDMQELTFSPSVEPALRDAGGWLYAFDKPADWVRTYTVSDDAGFANLQFQYDDSGAYILANVETIYIQFVSKSTTWGMDLSLWPPNFTRFVEHDAAWVCAQATAGSAQLAQEIERKRDKWMKQAKSTDAMDESVKQLPSGSWSRARRGSTGGRRDRGNTGNLIG